MSNSTNNSTNNQFPDMNVKFETVVVNPADLKVHAFVSEMGYAHVADDVFMQSSSHFNFYKKPVIDGYSNVLTNAAEVTAAQANGVTSLEVFVCDLQGIELRRFISFTHKYYRKNLRASYATVRFYKEYFKTPEGVLLSANINKRTEREKIAALMNTSDATIARLMRVGENKPEMFGLIEQGETSFKEVIDQIKAERLEDNARSKKEKVAQAIATSSPENDINRSIQLVTQSPPANQLTAPDIVTNTLVSDVHLDDLESNAEVKSTPKLMPLQSPTCNDVGEQLSLKLVKGTLEIENLGTIEFEIINGTAKMILNGATISNVEYDSHTMQQPYNKSTINSFSLTSSANACSALTFTIENVTSVMRNAA